MGQNVGAAVPFFGRETGPHLTPIYCYFESSNHDAWAEAYLPIKWHHDPSNCVATTHKGQTGQTDNDPTAQSEPFYKWLPKNYSCGNYLSVA